MLHDGMHPISIATHHARAYDEDTTITTSQDHVVLATAQINVRSENGYCLQLTALLDRGSQASFITEFAAQQLHLKRRRLQVPVTGIGCTNAAVSSGLVEFDVSSICDPGFNIGCTALVLPRLSQQLPGARLDPTLFTDLLNLNLADPRFYEPGPIDVILGADIYGHLLCGELKFCAATAIELNELVKALCAFNACEDGESSSKLTLDEIYCENFFERTTRRTGSGRYIVRYPFKPSADLSVLADTKYDAEKLYHYQNKRLNNDISFKTLYDEFMSEYLQLGYMQPVCEDFEPQPVCYIPHHGVYKGSSSTTKLRTVLTHHVKRNVVGH
ncbi:uncharacterized protein LOC118735311 [Rhagoletis pomonella]|uniref:uncharacterized protein LOC118735311 n=1 Tax=Rhagoletis pomonella TaxID=28610 RepID=UPI00177B282D|nr:uncharacterized protein LOC118735311 [Rhagoletis pomonella]